MRIICANILVLIGVAALLEGLASLALLGRNVVFAPKARRLARQYYTQYDSELGWVNKADINVADVYGPGGNVKINVQGFRSDHRISDAVPRGKTRIICSGDSYTFGYGVDNAYAWCELLARLNPGIEAVNLGGDGYGIDQAFLRYKKQTASIDHQLHVFAFITDDFYRMLSNNFFGYGKPVLRLENNGLRVSNVPVPEPDHKPILLRQLAQEAQHLRILEGIARLLRKSGGVFTEKTPEIAKPTATQAQRDEIARALFHKILEDLTATGRQRGVPLVLVYLPTIWELEKRPFPGWSSYHQWEMFLKQESDALGAQFINLFETFESLTVGEMVSLFIPEGQLPYPEGSFHLNEAGNALVARVIHERLKLGPTRSKLQAVD